MTSYQQELDFTISILQRMRLSVHLLHPQDAMTILDTGLRSILEIQTDYDAVLRFSQQWSRDRTIYKFLDQFMCNYIYFCLPETEEPTAVVIGPYLTIDPTQEMLLEQTERLGLPMHRLSRQVEFYAQLPVFNDPTAIMAVVSCLGEILWKEPESFHMVDVNYEQLHSLPHKKSAAEPIEQEDILLRMAQMEERYTYENELMEIVSRGLTNRAEVIMSSVSNLNFQTRVADPLRNMKNYCIICNTLLRKAAQKGGVHPLHLDQTSSDYARRIENIPSIEKATQLISEMIRTYCHLVRSLTRQQHSADVQKALMYIDANLSGEISLSRLGKLLKLSPGYLSMIFHRETGLTLTSYITSQRMKTASHLLRSTNLQIQTIAQLSGYQDPNYFSKQFKQTYGTTPLQYRKEQFALHMQNEDVRHERSTHGL